MVPDFIQARDSDGLRVFLINEIFRDGAFFQACRDGAVEMCKMLISTGVDVNSAVVDKQTPLFIACLHAHPACVDFLLAQGANVNVGEMSGRRTPLMATAHKDDTSVGLTLDQFIENRCLCMRSLLTANANVDQTDKYGYTALIFATWNFRLAEILVHASQNVNILYNNKLSILHIACARNNAGVVDLLLERGADIDAMDVDGLTPLHTACIKMFPTIIDLLLRHGAVFDIVDNNGITALQLALFQTSTSPNRVIVLQLMATCAQTRLVACSADWIRLARHEQHREL